MSLFVWRGKPLSTETLIQCNEVFAKPYNRGAWLCFDHRLFRSSLYLGHYQRSLAIPILTAAVLSTGSKIKLLMDRQGTRKMVVKIKHLTCSNNWPYERARAGNIFCQSNNQDGYGLACTQQLPNAINNNTYIRKKTCIFFPRCLHSNECKIETMITKVSFLAKNLSNLKIKYDFL